MITDLYSNMTIAIDKQPFFMVYLSRMFCKILSRRNKWKSRNT